MSNVWTAENVSRLLFSVLDDIENVPATKFERAAAIIGNGVTGSACRLVRKSLLSLACFVCFCLVSFLVSHLSTSIVFHTPSVLPQPSTSFIVSIVVQDVVVREERH